MASRRTTRTLFLTGLAGHPLREVFGKGTAQIGAACDHCRQALTQQHRLEPANGGFDFGKFWHSFQLGCVCARHKRC